MEKQKELTQPFREQYENFKKWMNYFSNFKNKTKTEFNVQTNLPMYNHQRVGAEFLIKRQKAILADEMGVGKIELTGTSLF